MKKSEGHIRNQWRQMYSSEHPCGKYNGLLQGEDGRLQNRHVIAAQRFARNR